MVETAEAATFAQSGSIVSVIENGATVGALRFNSLDAATTRLRRTGWSTRCCVSCPDTLIATPQGEVKVQALGVGDLVRTASGVDRAVVWIGEGRVLAPPGPKDGGNPGDRERGALGPVRAALRPARDQGPCAVHR